MSHWGRRKVVPPLGAVMGPFSSVPNGSRDHIKANFDIFDFELTDGEMAEIAELDKGVCYYNGTPELLASYAAFVPPVDEQK